jgi:hypothetical protein
MASEPKEVTAALAVLDDVNRCMKEDNVFTARLRSVLCRALILFSVYRLTEKWKCENSTRSRRKGH